MKKIILIVPFFLWLFMFAGCGNQVTETTDGEVIVDQSNQEEFTSTMADIYKKGGKMTCTMVVTTEGMTMDGTLYIDGERMRSDMKGNVGGMDIEMNTVIKDGYSYSRGNTSQEGWKMAYDDNEDDMEEWLNDVTTDTDVDSPMNFVCKKWVDGSKFDLPNNVQFKELTY